MRTIRLVGVALLVMAALAMVGFGALDKDHPVPFLTSAFCQASETGSAQAPSGSASGSGNAGQVTADTAHGVAGSTAAGADTHDAEHSGGHGNPVVPVLALLFLIILAAKIGGSIMEQIGQPSVLGELVFGVILGNLALLGFYGIENLFNTSIFGVLPAERIIEILGEIGVILLLFEVGLESNIKEMMSVGASSLLVATLGVVVPFLLGWGVGAWLLPDSSMWVHIFLGATLCATSVGITARVLKDLGKIQLRESKIVLGAAVIDDVMGLIVLAVVAGLISTANAGGELAPLSVIWIIAKAVLFLVGAVFIGQWGSPKVFNLASKMRGQHLLLTFSLMILFLFSFVANKIGLATIVGAFAAGLILDPLHYRELREREEHTIEELLHPISGFMVPIFFVYMGYKVDLSYFADTKILALAGALTLVAILSKQICSLGVLEKGLDKLSVGIGMIPRGEVGLIFASIGAGLMIGGVPVINDATFGAVVIMVIITTFITPPALKWSLNRHRGYEGASDDEMARYAAEKRARRKDYYRGQGESGGRDRYSRDRGRGRGRDRSSGRSDRSGSGDGGDGRDGDSRASGSSRRSGSGDSRDRGRDGGRDRGRGDGQDRGRGRSRDDSRGRGRRDARDQGRGDSRDRGRDEARDQGRDDSRDRGRGDTRGRGRGDSRDRGRGDAQDRGRNDSRDQSRTGGRDQDRGAAPSRGQDNRSRQPAGEEQRGQAPATGEQGSGSPRRRRRRPRRRRGGGGGGQGGQGGGNAPGQSGGGGGTQGGQGGGNTPGQSGGGGGTQGGQGGDNTPGQSGGGGGTQGGQGGGSAPSQNGGGQGRQSGGSSSGSAPNPGGGGGGNSSRQSRGGNSSTGSYSDST
jgi:Kef-type K+ transport system membrane component KefB